MEKEALLAALFAKGSGGGSALPDVAGNAGKVLKVNSGATGTEWGDVPNELPAIASGDAGKVLKVNSGETGTEWGEAGGVNIYKHTITWHNRKGFGQEYAGQGGIITIQIYSTRSTAYTWSTLRSYLGTNTIQASGIMYNSDKSIRYNVFSVIVNASNPRFDLMSYLKTTISDNTEVFVYNNSTSTTHSSADEFTDAVRLLT